MNLAQFQIPSGSELSSLWKCSRSSARALVRLVSRVAGPQATEVLLGSTSEVL